MATYVLSASSPCDLTNEYMEKRDIHYISLHYYVDDVEYIDDMGRSMDADTFFGKMAEGAMTRTSQVNVIDYVEYFSQFLSQGLDVVHLELSSGISGTYNSACIAVEELMETYPDRTVYLVDSLGASSGFGLLLDMAASRRDDGMSAGELYNWLMENRLGMQYWFFSTDLSYFVRGGRITKAAGFLGNLLNICPLLSVDAEGKLVVKEKIRTKKKVKSVIVDRMEEYAEGGTDYSGRCFICHSSALEDARDVAIEIEKRFPKLDGPVRIFNIGTVIGSHSGPGTVAVFFFGTGRK